MTEDLGGREQRKREREGEGEAVLRPVRGLGGRQQCSLRRRPPFLLNYSFIGYIRQCQSVSGG